MSLPLDEDVRKKTTTPINAKIIEMNVSDLGQVKNSFTGFQKSEVFPYPFRLSELGASPLF